MKTVLKPYILVPVGVVTTYGVALAAQKVFDRFAPPNFYEYETGTAKGQAIKAVKVIGVAVGISIIGTIAAQGVVSTLERTLWAEEPIFSSTENSGDQVF